jgi:hypothetical protein
MSKISARLVPIQLTDDQKRIRLDISRYLLSGYEDEPDLIYQIITQDETWVHHFDPETKQNRTCSESNLAHPLGKNLKGCHQQGR